MLNMEKVVQNLKEEFFADKDKFIEEYITAKYIAVSRFNYTSGKPVLIYQGKAYSRNGFFFAVILKDESYVASHAEGMDDVELEDESDEEESEYIPDEEDA